MKITTTGNYLTRDGTVARVTRIDPSGSPIGFVGRDGMIWCTDEGHVHSDRREHPWDIVSASTWRERVLKLIDGASLDIPNWILVNGEFQFTTPFTSVVIKRGNDGVELFSHEIFHAVVERRDELWREHKRAEDDANTEAIERILA